MSKKSLMMLVCVMLGGLLLSACQVSAQAATEVAEPTAAPTATLWVRPTAIPTAAPTATIDPAAARAAAAEQAARTYFDAVAQGDFAGAAGLLSNFSLSALDLTRAEAEAQLAGEAWSELEVLEVRDFDAQTVLVSVGYTAGGESRAELWPLRLENGQWRVNWANLIDFRTLTVPAQSVNDVTVAPQRLLRYSDRLELRVLAQNHRADLLVWGGGSNETLGTFVVAGKAVTAEKTQWVLNPKRSIPDLSLTAAGLFEEMPERVEIYRLGSGQPWFAFELE